MSTSKKIENNKYKYSAFISYSSIENELGQDWHIWLKNKIENFSLSKAQMSNIDKHHPLRNELLPCYVDKFEMGASSDLQQSLKDALDASLYLILLCNPKSLTSDYVRAELSYFQEVSRSKNIIYVCTSGQQAELLAEKPFFLPELVEVEPVVIDFRLKIDASTYYSDTDAKRLKSILINKVDLHSKEIERRCKRHSIATEKNLNRIMATLLGIPFGNFSSGAKMSHMSKLRATIFFATALTALIMFFVIYYNRARPVDQAPAASNNQRLIKATIFQSSVIELLNKLESSIDPQFDHTLSETLIPIIRTAIANSSSEDKSTEFMANKRAKFLYLQGRRHIALNEYQSAIRKLKESIDQVKKASRQKALNNKQKLQLAQCYLWISRSIFAQGMHSDALDFLEFSKEFVSNQSTDNPDNVALKLNGDIYQLMTELALIKNDNYMAEFWYQKSRGYFDSLMNSISLKETWKYELYELESLQKLSNLDLSSQFYTNKLIVNSSQFLTIHPNNIKVSRILISALFKVYVPNLDVNKTQSHIRFLNELREIFSPIVKTSQLPVEQLKIYVDAELSSIQYLEANMDNSELIHEQLNFFAVLIEQLKSIPNSETLYADYYEAFSVMAANQHFRIKKTPEQ